MFTLAVLMTCCLLHSFPAHAQTRDGITRLFERILDEETDPHEIRPLLAPLTAENLENLANQTEDKIQSVFLNGIELSITLNEADPEKQKLIRQQIIVNSEIAWELAAKYRRILNAWTDHGGDPKVIYPHRQFFRSLAIDLVTTTERQALAVFIRDWLISPSGGLRVAFETAVLVVVITGILFVSAAAKSYVRRRLSRTTNTSALSRNFFASSAYWLTLVISILVVLSLVGIRVSPLLAVFGGISFILGFALQDTIGNAVSGLMIMINRPFDLGHFVRAGNESGFVESMTIMSTKIRTADNQIIQIPNSKVWSDVIANANASDTRRVDLVFGISYSDDVGKAIAVLKRLVDEQALCLSTPEAQVFLGELGENSVNVFCRPWVATKDYWDVYWGLTAAAKEAFDENGISIPFPQVEVHLKPVEKGLTKEP
jgi:small conductance mechanosensitive channel